MFGFDTNVAIEGMIYFNMESERYLETLINYEVPGLKYSCRNHREAMLILDKQYDIYNKLSIGDRERLSDYVRVLFHS